MGSEQTRTEGAREDASLLPETTGKREIRMVRPTSHLSIVSQYLHNNFDPYVINELDPLIIPSDVNPQATSSVLQRILEEDGYYAKFRHSMFIPTNDFLQISNNKFFMFVHMLPELEKLGVVYYPANLQSLKTLFHSFMNGSHLIPNIPKSPFMLTLDVPIGHLEHPYSRYNLAELLQKGGSPSRMDFMEHFYKLPLSDEAKKILSSKLNLAFPNARSLPIGFLPNANMTPLLITQNHATDDPVVTGILNTLSKTNVLMDQFILHLNEFRGFLAQFQLIPQHHRDIIRNDSGTHLDLHQLEAGFHSFAPSPAPSIKQEEQPIDLEPVKPTDDEYWEEDPFLPQGPMSEEDKFNHWLTLQMRSSQVNGLSFQPDYLSFELVSAIYSQFKDKTNELSFIFILDSAGELKMVRVFGVDSVLNTEKPMVFYLVVFLPQFLQITPSEQKEWLSQDKSRYRNLFQYESGAFNIVDTRAYPRNPNDVFRFTHVDYKKRSTTTMAPMFWYENFDLARYRYSPTSGLVIDIQENAMMQLSKNLQDCGEVAYYMNWKTTEHIIPAMIDYFIHDEGFADDVSNLTEISLRQPRSSEDHNLLWDTIQHMQRAKKTTREWLYRDELAERLNYEPEYKRALLAQPDVSSIFDRERTHEMMRKEIAEEGEVDLRYPNMFDLPEPAKEDPGLVELAAGVPDPTDLDLLLIDNNQVRAADKSAQNPLQPETIDGINLVNLVKPSENTIDPLDQQLEMRFQAFREKPISTRKRKNNQTTQRGELTKTRNTRERIQRKRDIIQDVGEDIHGSPLANPHDFQVANILNSLEETNQRLLENAMAGVVAQMNEEREKMKQLDEKNFALREEKIKTEMQQMIHQMQQQQIQKHEELQQNFQELTRDVLKKAGTLPKEFQHQFDELNQNFHYMNEQIKMELTQELNNMMDHIAVQMGDIREEQMDLRNETTDLRTTQMELVSGQEAQQVQLENLLDNVMEQKQQIINSLQNQALTQEELLNQHNQLKVLTEKQDLVVQEIVQLQSTDQQRQQIMNRVQEEQRNLGSQVWNLKEGLNKMETQMDNQQLATSTQLIQAREELENVKAQYTAKFRQIEQERQTGREENERLQQFTESLKNKLDSATMRISELSNQTFQTADDLKRATSTLENSLFQFKDEVANQLAILERETNANIEENLEKRTEQLKNDIDQAFQRERVGVLQVINETVARQGAQYHSQINNELIRLNNEVLSINSSERSKVHSTIDPVSDNPVAPSLLSMQKEVIVEKPKDPLPPPYPTVNLEIPNSAFAPERQYLEVTKPVQPRPPPQPQVEEPKEVYRVERQPSTSVAEKVIKSSQKFLQPPKEETQFKPFVNFVPMESIRQPPPQPPSQYNLRSAYQGSLAMMQQSLRQLLAMQKYQIRYSGFESRYFTNIIAEADRTGDLTKNPIDPGRLFTALKTALEKNNLSNVSRLMSILAAQTRSSAIVSELTTMVNLIIQSMRANETAHTGVLAKLGLETPFEKTAAFYKTNYLM
jgi:hypothetical protein